MKVLGIVLLCVLALGGCAVVSVPMQTVADPSHPLSKATPIAFYREPDMRIQKRLFAERIERYLAEAGFNVVDADDAEILVAIHIATESIRIEIDTGFYPQPRTLRNSRLHEGESRFSFLAYEDESLRTRAPKTVWEGSVVVAQRVMQQNERMLVMELFSHFGTSFEGKARADASASVSAAAGDHQPAPAGSP